MCGKASSLRDIRQEKAVPQQAPHKPGATVASSTNRSRAERIGRRSNRFVASSSSDDSGRPSSRNAISWFTAAFASSREYHGHRTDDAYELGYDADIPRASHAPFSSTAPTQARRSIAAAWPDWEMVQITESCVRSRSAAKPIAFDRANNGEAEERWVSGRKLGTDATHKDALNSAAKSLL